MASYQRKSSTTLFYECLELVEVLAKMSDWSTLVALTHVDRWLRLIIFRLFQYRVTRFLAKFVGANKHPRFFELMEKTGAVVVGSLVRCMLAIKDFDSYDKVHPRQLNIIIPYRQNSSHSDSSLTNFDSWRRFFTAMGYYDYNEMTRGNGPPHYNVASVKHWSLFFQADTNKHISLILSRTSSAVAPLLQSSHTSNFHVMSSTRFYSFYPQLSAGNLNVNTRIRVPPNESAFDSFNFGLLTIGSTAYFETAGGVCGEACPHLWRSTLGLPGVGIARWGGFRGTSDLGEAVSAPDVFGQRRVHWRVEGECFNQNCPNVSVCMNLVDSIY